MDLLPAIGRRILRRAADQAKMTAVLTNAAEMA